MAQGKYPEHEKLSNCREKSQAIGEFCEWLQSEKGIFLAQRHKHNDDCWGTVEVEVPLALGGTYGQTRPSRQLTCGYNESQLRHICVRLEDLLAGFFDIDPRKLEQEKRDILDECRR